MLVSHPHQHGFRRRFLRSLSRSICGLALCVGGALGLAAQQAASKASLEVSETLFSVLAALNSCGYDQGVAASGRLRAQVRAELARAVEPSQAAEAREQLCRFYRDHQQADPGRDLAQYVSLALSLGEPPAFAPTVKESDLPPDASYVLGIVPLLARFYEAAGLGGIWQKHQAEYEALIDRFHDPVSRALLDTDVYLKLPLSGYVGRRFVIYLDAMAAPGQVNARNYGSDYFIVVAPEGGTLPIHEIRHTYLHFILDPFALKRPAGMKRLQPLLSFVQDAPMDEAYKKDITLLLTESLIRAIEARTAPGGKSTEGERVKAVQAAMEEGFVLARYFYDTLVEFEKHAVGLRDAYSDMLRNLDVGRESKRAEAVVFRGEAAPEVVRASNPQQAQLLELAEQRLAAGDAPGAQALAQEALNRPDQDAARALFVLARAATLNRDMQGARTYFERTLEVAREPRVMAWSHIYLGRIFDLQENREAALRHYRAALAAGEITAETRAAAERGLQQPYQPPVARQREKQEEP